MSARASPLARLPRWMSHWLGYRDPDTPPSTPPNYVVWLWTFIGAFSGLSIIQAVFVHSHHFVDHHVPSIIASYGASAVLCYGAIEAPLAQPRALMAGHFISAVIGVCITKLFSLLPADRLEQLRWLAGCLSAATAIVVMQITETTHPPAGATALLAAVSPDMYSMGWYYLPIILLSSTLVLVSALLINNIQRRYPVYWWEPVIPPMAKPLPSVDAEKESDESGRQSPA
ncbi:HPP family protein [Mycena venus]|uniref:HPP family protein n=1 Tax=Mycena venus TaxID=2733690 RepID=A0A8H7CN57_9AGAR|nr:HPP family protein [Mycena venus]